MRVAFLATRIAGTDGVSLEAVHWREILRRMGHQVTFVAGKLDTSGILIPELHFNWPKVVELHDKVVYGNNDYRQIEAEIFAVAGRIEGKIREVFNNNKRPDLLVVPNALSLPMHFPLAVAIARVIEELRIPTIARHHDFWWERQRFLKSSMFEFFKRWFPPDLPTIKHVVINSLAKEELKKRKGINSTVIWDCFDFESSLNEVDSFSRGFKKDFGIKEDDVVFLQATRIVPRKRIEISIDLVSKLGLKNSILVVAGDEGDEGSGYKRKLAKMARDKKVRAIFIGERVSSKRKVLNGKKIYSLWDCYVNCDFCTYPTMIEGFGNQFVEAIYFRKPIILTPYEVYKKDIAPLGFKVIEISDKVNRQAIEKIRRLLDDRKKLSGMVDFNFEQGKKNFSYQATWKRIKKLGIDIDIDID